MRLIHVSILVLTILGSCWLHGQESPANSSEPSTTQNAEERPLPIYERPHVPEHKSSGLFVEVMAKLLVILGVIVFLAFLAKKYLPNRFVSSEDARHLKIVQTLPLGSRKFISLIEADGQRILVGITDQNINLIDRVGGPSFDRELEQIGDMKTVGQLLEEDS